MAASPDPTSSKPRLVGFEADMNKIMNAMLDPSVQELSVVHIVGPRGVGKTYLAKEIYTSTEVQRHFDVRVWLPVAHYIFSSLAIKHMREQLSIEDEADISNFLRGKRYCVVVDNLSDTFYSSGRERLSSILRELPDNNKGNRVLVTRRPEYPECWDNPVSMPILHFEVGPRSHEESLEMLLQAAFPKDPWDGCPAGEVDDLAMKFVSKCEGLPWPLRFLGGLLSELPWNEVLDRIQAMEAAGMSFVDFAMRYRDLLPPYEGGLKVAFLYFLTFPEGAEIRARSLFRMLLAEGIDLVHPSGNQILEVLTERSMIEVTKRYFDGSIKCCRLHDLLFRLLAIHEAKEKRFVWTGISIIDLFDARDVLPSYMVKRNHKFGDKTMDVAELADVSCIFNFGENFPLGTPLMSNRVLKIDDTKNNVDVVREVNKKGKLKYLDSSNLRLLHPLNELLKMRSLVSLTTLDVGGTSIETLPDPINFPNLTTLLLRNTKVQEIPISFKELECLDVRDTFVRSLPDSLWNNRRLSSVLASDALQHLNGPPSSADLRLLSVLKTVHVSNKWGKRLPKFKYNMNKLGLSYFKNAFSPYKALNWDIITRLLSKMWDLSSLKIQGSDVPREIIDARTCPSYKKGLKKLSLGGSYSLFSLSGIEIPPLLITLTLENFEFEEDPMPTLGKLQHLKTLCLRWLLYSTQAKKMICTNGEFPQLETLQLSHICGLEEWSVEEGALPEITYVVIERCKALKDLSGPLLIRTTPLKELHLHAMPPGLTTKFSEFDLPFVKITKN